MAVLPKLWLVMAFALGVCLWGPAHAAQNLATNSGFETGGSAELSAFGATAFVQGIGKDSRLASSVPATLLPSGLVASWSAEGDGREATGNYPGNVGAGVTFSAGLLGTGFLFDGTGDGVRVKTTKTGLNLTSAWTLSAWVRPRLPGVDARQDPLVWKSANDRYNRDTYYLGWEVALAGAGAKTQGRFVAGLERASDDASFDVFSKPHPPGVMYHVVASYDGSVLQVFVDGVVESRRTIGKMTAYVGSDDFRIGSVRGTSHGNAGTFRGLIDEVAVFNRALRDEEVVALHQGYLDLRDSGGGRELPSAPIPRIEQVDHSSITLSWPAVDRPLTATNYVVSRASTSGGPFVKIGETREPRYRDANLPAATSYCYVVSSVATNGQSSAYSSAACAATLVVPDNGIRGDSQDSEFRLGIGAGGTEPFISAITLQSDGKILIGGKFQGFQGSTRTNLARLNSDGSLDSSFSALARVDGTVWDIAVQADQSIVVAGQFTRANTNRSSRIARFLADGTIDPRFAAAGGANEMVGCVLPMQDQETGESFLVIGGAFTSVQGSPRSRVAFLNPDGSLRKTAAVPSLDGQVFDLEDDGKGGIIVGGAFQRRILRLHPDGRADLFFEALLINGDVWALAVQRDGKILVGGDFTVVEGRPRSRIARLNPDGSLDESFNPRGGFTIPGSEASVLSLAIQDDGRIDVAGAFLLADGKRHLGIARLKADGQLDTGFNPVVDGIVYRTTVQRDGKVLLGGAFQSVNGQAASALTRLFGDPPVPVPPTLERARRFLGSRLAFNVGGKAQQVYTIQSSSNLVTWQSVRVLTNANGLHLFSTPLTQDPGPRFFRAIEGRLTAAEGTRSRSLALGVDHSLAVASDGTLWGWGSNTDGRAGLGAAERSDNPARIHERQGWVCVSAGSVHSAAIDADGFLWTWGKSEQTGSGAKTDIRTPTRLPGEEQWMQVSCGELHSLGIRRDGSLWAWGRNTSGQLGDGTQLSRAVPRAIIPERTWLTVAAGAEHTGAIASDGTLWCWGSNERGQLGTGSIGGKQTAPGRVGTADNWAWVAAGGSFTVAGRTDGTLWTFGGNDGGQLGLGTNSDSPTPTKIGSGSNWIGAACGAWHTQALQADGSLWAWGSNTFGQLGLPGLNARRVPTRVGTGQDWIGVAGGLIRSMALARDGTLMELSFGAKPLAGVWATDVDP